MRFHVCPKHLKPLLLVCKDKKTIAQIHAFMILTGFSTHGNTIGRLIASYARMDNISSARKLFENLPRRGVDAYNAMIIAYSRNGNPGEVMGLYKRMAMEGVRPDSSIFTVAIKACISLMDMEMGEEVWRRALDSGYAGDVFVGSSMLNLYAKCGKMDEAMVIFDQMTRKDLVCWTTMVTGFAQSGRPRDAIEAYRRMQKEGMEGDIVVMVALLLACANLGDLKAGLSIHGYMTRRDLPLDIVIQTSLVDMYAKHGFVELAAHVFRKMSHKNVVSWAALISGYAQNGFAGKALDLVMEMQDYEFKPDLACLVGALLSCSQVGFLKLGKSIHGYIVRNLDFDRIAATSLIDMYSKCGELSSSRIMFDQIDSRDLISWNAMIASYGVHGHGREALARGGQVEKALELIDSMNSEPGLTTLVALLSGCLTHRKFSVGEIAAKKILYLNPDDLGVHALVSNLFAVGKKWDEVAGMRKIMKRTGMRKVPGYSVVEVNGKLHAFLKDDKSHHQYEDIIHILDKLDYEMKAKYRTKDS
ncbi:putative pentatricopeptide repeat-containing protein At3g25060, mitochondrial [Carica papaya]|uniref:putative pentatricopeptide repeat-containing protein At3g25060, mitochondrial n=1 Tax=Carica papaya TaxID=3649 RepID=UPI000B8CA7AA|nr:putative pentatricopeptide repeat-containing protein At3g25060, mitochondrial [Carica papaya]